ncbi:polyubiquitin-like [Epinephelus fuscoguttatus]|uniref:polyubiquitin-like n=1 Tax=Epinephelus fuscoguttatus TaxID=293821 RepID=UPI0020D00F4C|nr:polyubiquitin-like [Epinephelus fuscoguttatus]
MGIQLSVRGIRGEEKTIHLCDTREQFNSIRVLQLTEKIIEKFGYPWQPSELRLIYCDRELEEPALLSECGIRHMSTILVVRRVPEETREMQQLATNSTDMGIQLKVHGIRGEMKTIDLCDTEEQLRSITVQQLKEKIKEEFGYQWQPSELHLIYSGRQLEEHALLSQCLISHRSTIQVSLRLRGGGKSVEIDLCDTKEQLRSIRVLQLEEKILERRDDLGLTGRELFDSTGDLRLHDN